MADDTGSAGRRIQSVENASEILTRVQQSNGATLGQLHEECALSRGTLHTYLSTLTDCGFLTKADGTYRLGFRFLTMGDHVRNGTPLYTAGQAEVDALADTSGEYVHLVVEHGGRQIAIYERRGKQAVGTGYHLQVRAAPQHLHDNASGKAILSRLPPERVDDIVSRDGLERQTERTITDPAELQAELETVRERGYAINDEEEIRGLRAVGAPILDSDGAVAGAVSVTGPTSRLQGERFDHEIPELVLEAANLIEVNLETAAFDGAAQTRANREWS